MVKFNLREGMFNETLLRELRGRVSGESRDQVQQYLSYAPRINPELVKTHEVAAIDHAHEYAIIRKYHRNDAGIFEDTTDARFNLGGLRTQESNYFLVGINSDDQLYFMHPLFRLPSNILDDAIKNGNVMGVVDWCNRVDERYTDRIQGDVISQHATITAITRMETIIGEKNNDSSLSMTIRLAFGLYQAEDVSIPISDTEIMKKHLILPGRMYEDVTKFIAKHKLFKTDGWSNVSSISIGNRHKMITDGVIIRAQALRGVFFVVGSYLELEHPEHKTIHEQIPDYKALVVSIQRGSLNSGQDD